MHCRTQPWLLGACRYWRSRRSRSAQTITASIRVWRHLHDEDISHQNEQASLSLCERRGSQCRVWHLDIYYDLARHVHMLHMHNNMIPYHPHLACDHSINGMRGRCDKEAYRAGHCVSAGAALQEAVMVAWAVGCYRAARGALTGNEALCEAQHWCAVRSPALCTHGDNHLRQPILNSQVSPPGIYDQRKGGLHLCMAVRPDKKPL